MTQTLKQIEINKQQLHSPFPPWGIFSSLSHLPIYEAKQKTAKNLAAVHTEEEIGCALSKAVRGKKESRSKPSI